MRRDNNRIGRWKKSDTGNIERDRHTSGDAGRKLTGIAVPKTAGCEIVMVLFGRVRGRRGFAGGGASSRANTKRVLAKQAREVSVAFGTQLQ